MSYYDQDLIRYLQVHRLADDARLPSRAHEHDAGWDLYVHRTDGTPGIRHICYTGIAVAIPDGFVGLLLPRSSSVNTGLRLANSVGVIDSGYRGEIMGVFDCRTIDPQHYYQPGDRFAQLVIVPVPRLYMVEVPELPESDRGTGGFGSSGR